MHPSKVIRVVCGPKLTLLRYICTLVTEGGIETPAALDKTEGPHVVPTTGLETGPSSD